MAVAAHLVYLVLKSGALGQNTVIGILVLSLGNAHNRRPNRPIAIKGLLVKIVEEGAQRVKIMLRGWIELMVVTHGATNRKPHECGSERFCALAGDVDTQLLRDGAAFITAHAQPHIPTADQRVKALHRQ